MLILTIFKLNSWTSTKIPVILLCVPIIQSYSLLKLFLVLMMKLILSGFEAKCIMSKKYWPKINCMGTSCYFSFLAIFDLKYRALGSFPEAFLVSLIYDHIYTHRYMYMHT